MKIINLFAGPGSGKSTTAAGLFHKMKIEGCNVEMVTEYAKDMTWENRHNVLSDQLYLLAKQNRRIHRLEGKVDYVVTDSPIIMGVVYTDPKYYPSFFKMIGEIFHSYNNCNFFLHRPETYSEVGRNQTLTDAKILDTKIIKLLEEYEINYKEINVTDKNLFDKIMKWSIDN